jgi:hypothetical protein
MLGSDYYLVLDQDSWRSCLALLVSFETRHCDEAACHFTQVERRVAAAERLADAQAIARATAHRHNLKAAKAAMTAVEQRLAEAERSGGLASVAEARHLHESKYPLPSYQPWHECQEDRLTFTSFLEDAERRRRKRVTEERNRRRRMVSRPRRSDDGAGPSNATPPPPPSDVNAAAEDSEDDVLF